MICLKLFDDLWVLNSIIKYRSTLIRPSRPTHLVDFQHFHKKSVSDEAAPAAAFIHSIKEILNVLLNVNQI